MKKVLIVVIISVLGLCFLTACNKTIVGYDTYFNNFSSTAAFTKATEVLRLENFEELKPLADEKREVKITRYDDVNNVYIISESVVLDGTTYTVNGFCSENELYIEPKYIEVLGINGDYAIVTRFAAVGSHIAYRIGLVKFRGENKGYEFGFSYNYAVGIVQYMFLDSQYLLMLGDVNLIESSTSTSSGITYNYATIYDYTTAKGESILEIARVGNVLNSTVFTYADGNLLSSLGNTVRFYKLDSINQYGFLDLKDEYSAFDSTFDPNGIQNAIYYIGNNWFIISSTYASSETFDTYDMTKEQGDTLMYIRIKSVRYNTKSKNFYDTDRVALVANKYTDELVLGITNTFNAVAEYDKETGKGYYVPAAMPASRFVKDGYSIVYYYYAFYDMGYRDWAMSFSIYDSNASRLDFEVIMPLFFVDGMGVQNADPSFDKQAIEAEYYTFSKKQIVLEATHETVGFDTYLVHDGMVMAYNMDITDIWDIKTYVGAYDPSYGLALPFKYHELTPFFGGYATGSVIEGSESNEHRVFYRINKSGREEILDDVFFLREGVYITIGNEKYGLKANDGRVLLENKYEDITVVNNYLKNGQFVESTVITIENGMGVAYKLS